MRNEKRQTITKTLASVQGYHSNGRGYECSESYAYMGFKSNKYFTSDRTMPLDEHFNRADGKPLKGYGLEIETECLGLSNQIVYAEVLTNIIFAHFPADLFKMQNDASLRGDTNAECITQVMTKEFIRNNYANFKLMYDTYFKAFRISCGINCGMHVNISNGCFGKSTDVQTVAIRKFYYIINQHFTTMCLALKRNTARTGYCGRMSHVKSECKTMDLSRQTCSHGVCFNLGHFNAGRIELRLVGGQPTYGAFRNTLETVFHLVDKVKTISWDDCDNLVKVFSGCNQYVYDRLKSDVLNGGGITQIQLDAIAETVKREQLL